MKPKRFEKYFAQENSIPETQTVFCRVKFVFTNGLEVFGCVMRRRG